MNYYLVPAYLAVTLLSLNGCGQTNKAPLLTEHTRPLQVIKLQNLNTQNIITFSGLTKSIDTAKLSFRVPGTVESINIAVGDHVQQGQVIASIDPHDYQVQQQELQARLDEAISAHKLAAIELKRVQQAISNNATAQINLDRAQSTFERSKAMVEVVNQNLNKANDALRYSQLRAPFDGVIGQQDVQPFEQVIPAIPVFTLHKPEQLEVIIDVPENLVNHFNENTQASISWYDSYHSIDASISDIGTVSHPLKQTYPVTFKLAAHDKQLLPGKSVKVEVNLNSKVATHCIPYSAITSGEKGHKIFTVKDQKVLSKYVNIIDIKGKSVCITGDIQHGDDIVVMGTSYLKNGDNVSKLQFQNSDGEQL